MNMCIFKPITNGKKTTTRRPKGPLGDTLPGAVWIKNTSVSTCTHMHTHIHTRTHTHIHTHKCTSWPHMAYVCHAHSRFQSSPLEPGSFQLYFPDPFVSCLLLSRSLLARPLAAAPGPPRPPSGHLPDVAAVVRLACLALLLLSLLTRFLRLLLLLVLPADTTPKVP